jgi:membrane protease YdiL (CAAX protease family)
MHKKPKIARVWFMLTTAPILAAGVSTVVAVLVGIRMHTDGQAAGRWFLLSLPYILMGTHVILFLMLLVCIRADGVTLRSLGWNVDRKSLRRELAIGLASGIVLWVFTALGLTPLLELAQRVIGDIQLGGASVERLIVANRIPWLIVGSISAGIVEESVYRGYAMRLSHRMGDGWALVVSSALFGFVHFGEGLWPMLGTIILGAVLVVISRWRRNLLVPAVTHAIINTVTILSL